MRQSFDSERVRLRARLLATLVSLPVALLAVSCSDSSADYFPLNPGWDWQYAMRLVTVDGERQAKYLIANLPTFEFEGAQTIPRRTPAGGTVFFVRDSGGVSRVGEAGAGQAPRHYPSARLVLPANLSKVGATWQGDTRTMALEVTSHAAGALYKIEVDVPLIYRIDSVDDDVTVPAGQFHSCIRVHATGSTLAEVRKQVGLAEVRVDLTEWYAAGIGLVRSVREETTSSSALPAGFMEMQLEVLRR